MERLAASDGTSVNQFLVMAAAEKMAAIQTAGTFFAERKGHGNRKVVILTLKGGEALRAADRLE